MPTTSHSWETDTLSCTPDGITAEAVQRDVLTQLIDTTRHRVAQAARLLEQFAVISRIYSPHDDTAPNPTDADQPQRRDGTRGVPEIGS
jgi:hypothetical protein